jgi:hypothetical protein
MNFKFSNLELFLVLMGYIIWSFHCGKTEIVLPFRQLFFAAWLP